MLKQQVLCFEHQALYPENRLMGPVSDGQVIPQSLFDEFFEQSQHWLHRDWQGRQAILKTSHYVGIVQGKCGHSLEILPKTGKTEQSPTALRLLLLNMLRCSPDMPFRLLTQQALLQLARFPLLDVFIRQAVDSMVAVLQRGLKQHYQTTQDNSPVLRGRLLVQQHIQHNYANSARFYGQYDEYMPDCAENRLLRLALNRLKQLNHDPQIQQLIQSCILRMSQVLPSVQPVEDFKAIQLGRNYQYYANALQWAKLIISGFSPVMTSGKQPAFSLLFDMNKLFECYVSSRLQTQLPLDFVLKVQHQGTALLSINSQPQQQLKPDIMLYKNDQPVAILDSKWKLLQGNTFAKVKPSDADLYQMFAYGAAYLPQGGSVCLIYPRTTTFTGGIERAAFQHIRDVNVNLHLLPFCLVEGKLLDIPFLS